MLIAADAGAHGRADRRIYPGRWCVTGGPDPTILSRPITARGELGPAEQSTITLFKSASPSVAFITTDIHQINHRTRSVEDIPQSAGSGFIWR